MKTPAHKMIRQYRLMQASIIAFLGIITWRLIEWIMATPYGDLSDWHLAPITAALPALVAGMFKLAELIMKKAELDDEDHHKLEEYL